MFSTKWADPAQKTYQEMKARAHAALQARAVRFEEEPHLIAKMPDHDLWLASFRDCENNLMALMSEVRSTAPPHRE